MSFFNSFIHGDKLTEFMIEGHNPDARQKLSTTDVDALRQAMRTGEALRAYVLGRVVMSGRGVWAMTEQQVLMLEAGQEGVQRIEARQVEHFEAVRGRFGHTVRLTSSGRTHSMYGVDAELAQAMQEALSGLGVKASFENKPALGTLWAAYSGPHPSVNDCLQDARQRLLPA
mgnify:FL=1